jgi:hypothetical protein
LILNKLLHGRPLLEVTRFMTSRFEASRYCAYGVCHRKSVFRLWVLTIVEVDLAMSSTRLHDRCPGCSLSKHFSCGKAIFGDGKFGIKMGRSFAVLLVFYAFYCCHFYFPYLCHMTLGK